eukprot:3542869-Pyramimonas_sp.AAC.1
MLNMLNTVRKVGRTDPRVKTAVPFKKRAVARVYCAAACAASAYAALPHPALGHPLAGPHRRRGGPLAPHQVRSDRTDQS